MLDNIMDWVLTKVIFPIVWFGFIAVCMCVPILIYSCYKDSKSPILELKKVEWTCTKTYIYYTHIKGVRYEHIGCSQYVKNQEN
jgi:hypothetical protein